MKRKLTLIIVDDQQGAIDHALSVLRAFIDLSVKETFTDPVAALKYLKENHVDFVLLDVEMPIVDGMAFMMQMPPEIKVMLATAHRQYAVDAYEQEAVDYLMKPITPARFSRALNRMKNALKIQADRPILAKDEYYYFMLKGPVKFQRTKVNFAELVYIEARGGYTYFYLISDLTAENQRLLQLQKKAKDGKQIDPADREKGKYEGLPCMHTLQEINEIVAGSSLMQIHKSYILNTDYFRQYVSRVVVLTGLEAIKLPTGLRKNFPEFFDYLDRQHLPAKE